MSSQDVREHSLEWLQEISEILARRHRHDQANSLMCAVLAAATGAGSEEAAAQVETLLHELVPPEEDASLSHLLNPDAQTDWNSLRQASAGQSALGVSRQRGTTAQEQAT